MDLRFISFKVHTQYNELLGWDNIPGLTINKYVKDGHLKINSQGTRNDQDFSYEIPVGKKRVICSGDSFTFGKGVSNGNTWCSQLNEIEPRLETINLGQSAYSFGQSYLKYQRDKNKFKHDIHIFAFVTGDFARMARKNFTGSSKPILKIQDDKIIVDNYPVPKFSSQFPLLIENALWLKQLRSIEFFNSNILKNNNGKILSDSEIKEIVKKIVLNLRDEAKKEGKSVLFVHLPCLLDFDLTHSMEWEDFFQALEADENINYLNLIPVFHKLLMKKDRVPLNFFLKNGHYNNLGNKWAAYHILFKLDELGLFE